MELQSVLSEFSPANGALGLVIVALLLTVLLGVKIVPQSQEYVVTRLGRYARTLGAGVGWIIPLVERVHARISIADQVLRDTDLGVVSKDNAVFRLQLLVVYRVVKPELAVFRIDNVRELVRGLVDSLVRAEVGRIELDALQSEREALNIAIREKLAQAGADYGVLISRAEVTGVTLEASTQADMAEVLAAERSRRATETRAAGDKRATELAADAALYRAQREAEAARITADATAYANRVIGEAIAANGVEPAQFQIAERQIAALTALASSSNAKLIMLPGDAADGFTRAAAILSGEGLARSVALPAAAPQPPSVVGPPPGPWGGTEPDAAAQP
ncbi:SPFH domain-containing protein [Rubrimonas sp.]|uniref:SPFH domain-containing protein n=1 Tax=Rubrimonas sp. TaxID=2036015 RepID=UPI002FDD033D